MIAGMFRRLFAFILIAAGTVLAQTNIPDTPAGHTLEAWLDAFNSGDRARLERYIHDLDHEKTVDGMIAFRNQTGGGFDLLSIESSEPLHIRFRVKEKGGPTTALGNLQVKDGTPASVESFGLRALPPGVILENVTLDSVMRQKAIDGIQTNLKDYYIDPTLAQKMTEMLRIKSTAGGYDKFTDGDAFAAQLTKDLREVSHDKHLSVAFNPFKTPHHSAPTAEDNARYERQMEHDNCGFEKVEILPNNIGYIKFNAFMDASFCGPTVNAAMGFVSHTDALIFDLRQNGGGSPAMVTLIASYLFEHPTHLIDIYNRKEDTTTQNWTLSYLPGVRLTKQPVYVLTSKVTFSGAEEFAFDLKNQKRATIVGETTGGGAHPVSGHIIADYFMVNVPFAKSLDPVSKTNWEGTGVEPDVKVSATDALATAEQLASQKLKAAETGK